MATETYYDYELRNYVNDINREYVQVLSAYDETGTTREVYTYGNERLTFSDGQDTFTYDLNTEGRQEVFPLQLGSGGYEISLYENISGKKYAQAGVIGVNAAFSREDVPFLYPNVYVNYGADSPAVAKADELCADKSPKEAYQAICDYIQTEYVYDFIKAVTVSPGELPDIQGCFEKKMGICQDLSAMMVAMLRSQGISSRLMMFSLPPRMLKIRYRKHITLGYPSRIIRWHR
jgi:transglutaminase-like putative cysteine protease